MSKHYLIFIHGIGELKNDDSPDLSYDKLWKRLGEEYNYSPAAFNRKFGRIDVIWHVGEIQKAEEAIAKAAFPHLNPSFLRPMDQLRDFMTFFVGDVAAYVSEDVNFVRRTVWEQIWSYQDSGKSFKQLLEAGATYSFVTHSLGTVIAFDYLAELFDPEDSKLFVPTLNSEKRPEDAALQAKGKAPSVATHDELELLQKGFRHFFSMGSPIGLFFMRKGALWSKDHPFADIYNPVRPVPGNGRVWLNFWDKHDLIAYPLANLFQKNPVNSECKLLDIAVNTGWLFRAHVDYWKNRKVAQEIMHWIAQND